MTHPVKAQLALTAQLHGLTSRIATLLQTPATEDRTQKVHANWQEMARLFGPYQRALAAVHARQVGHGTLDINQARADMIRHGAYRASLWDKVGHLLDRQSLGVQTPLIRTEHKQRITRRDDLLSYLTDVMHHLANPTATKHVNARQDQHPDIPLSGEHFINLMQAAYRISLAKGATGPLKFLDVGCGGGTKVIMAAHFFAQADGLEYDSDYVAHAQRTLKLARLEQGTIFEGDACTFQGYAAYDIVYFYRPISDPVTLTDMETYILDQVAPGTIVIAPMEYSLSGVNADRVAPIHGGFYLAHTSAADAAAIKAKALDIGPDWRIYDAQSEQAFGFWWPIIDASRCNGFCLPR